MYLTASQIRKKYGISKAIIYDSIKQGKLDFTDFGRKTFYIKETDLLDFFEKSKTNFKELQK